MAGFLDEPRMRLPASDQRQNSRRRAIESLYYEVYHRDAEAGGKLKGRKPGIDLRRTARILLVDDFDHWRRFVASLLRENPEWQVIGEASDGLEAIQKTEELRPDLIVLDLGLPKLNGIEVARQIRKLAPETKIIFLSQECSADVVREALCVGAQGYVVKTKARSDLLASVKAVLEGRQFVSSG